MTAPRHFVDFWNFSPEDLRRMLDGALARKKARKGWTHARVDADAPAAGRTLAMIFQANSTRTRFSFDAAMRQLGGACIISTGSDMQLGRGETIEDTARVLSRMVDAVMIRTRRHEDVERFAAAASTPVINGLTERGHPCQVLADIMTFEEHRGDIAGRRIAWIGDGNNVCSSFIQASAKFGFVLAIACPAKYRPQGGDVERAERQGARIEITDDIAAAATGAHCVVSDAWVSMGDTDHEERREAFADYCVDEALMAKACSSAVFLHCLPAHRGEEVSAGVIDGPASLVWDEAENRVHAQKAVLAWSFSNDTLS